jgi:cobalt-zinc-cadmium efflux system membrane fusion protein
MRERRRIEMGRWRLGAPLLGILALMLGGCGHGGGSEDVEPATAGADQAIVISESQATALAIQTRPVVRERLRFTLPVPGIVLPAPGHELVISAPVDGRITRLFVREGDHVAAGDPLVEIESLTIGNLVADYIQAQADAVYMTQQFARLEKLQDKGVGSLRELERVRAESQRADASLSAARSRLIAIGFTTDHIERWSPAAPIDPRLTIRAGIGGIVSTAYVVLGEAVDVHERILVLIDPSQVMVRAFLSPQDLELVQTDGDLTLFRDETGEGALTGKIATINPTLDATNRAATVNGIFATEDNWPVPGQNLRVQVGAVTATPVLSVPLSAVVFEGESAVVFVQLAPRRYDMRRIEIARMTGTDVVVTAGLVEGEEVACSSVFQLKALGRLEQYGEE